MRDRRLGARWVAACIVLATASSAAWAVTITTLSPLPAAETATSYSQAFTATGGTAPYTWSVVSGTLPPGLNLSNGTLSGVPTGAGSYTFNVRAIDATSASATKTFVLVITVGEDDSVVPAIVAALRPVCMGLTASPSTTVAGRSITLTTSCNRATSYEWSLNGAVIQTTTTPSTATVAPGPGTAQYSVVALYKNIRSAAYTANVSVLPNNPPIATFAMASPRGYAGQGVLLSVTAYRCTTKPPAWGVQFFVDAFARLRDDRWNGFLLHPDVGALCVRHLFGACPGHRHGWWDHHGGPDRLCQCAAQWRAVQRRLVDRERWHDPGHFRRERIRGRFVFTADSGAAGNRRHATGILPQLLQPGW